jgi:uncharacterized iron-regulated membrane protein
MDVANQQSTRLYNLFWRWHFCAAIFIAPLLLTIALSGIGYLFYPDIEKRAYHHLFFGNSGQTQRLTIDEGIAKAVEQNKGFSISKVIVLEKPYHVRITLKNDHGDERYVFFDENYQIVGTQHANYTFSNVMRNLHSSLVIGGTVVNYLVELAACWAIFLLLTGLYMTFKGKAFKKIPRPTKRQQNKTWHTWIGTIITIPMIIIIFTGLPWSAWMGNVIYTAAQNYPSIGIPLLKQQPPTSEISEIPWATRKQSSPLSSSPQNNKLSVEQLMANVEKAHISKPYTIIYPKDNKAVYTVAKGSNTGITGLDVNPDEEVTAYFDQYSGVFLSKVSYQEYGILAKWFTWGIPLHEGHLFGWPNKVLNLIVCLLFLAVIFWGFKVSLLRIKERKFFAPPKVSSKLSLGFLCFIAVLGMIMPLFGLSLIVVAMIETILYLVRKIKRRGENNEKTVC